MSERPGWSGVIEALEAEWVVDGGSIHRCRLGDDDPVRGERFVGVPGSLADRPGSHPDAAVPSRVVTLLWWIPTMLERKRDGIADGGGDLDRYDTMRGDGVDALADLLGYP